MSTKTFTTQKWHEKFVAYLKSEKFNSHCLFVGYVIVTSFCFAIIALMAAIDGAKKASRG